MLVPQRTHTPFHDSKISHSCRKLPSRERRRYRWWLTVTKLLSADLLAFGRRRLFGSFLGSGIPLGDGFSVAEALVWVAGALLVSDCLVDLMGLLEVLAMERSPSRGVRWVLAEEMVW
jgi:hypothetical protein